ncbi:thioredoxin family protein [Virgibacillus alimentarius]|uniref:Thiol-disulfide isomerase/thioredoxin n=1 Tax=Virgibacillus alimentarius TaxID=698769 RepID=A0ABS4SDM4_9BACI|nr:thioredoxin family protein [Virgibacillus alimentarius]MBP2258502.1 thiol-disulfide isomerase/thioredoxin [Virgibacillus alimentarius]
MDLNGWFNKGLTSEEYTKTLDKLKDGFHHVYKNFTLPEDNAFFQSVKEKNLRVIVLAEPWCGHCMMDLPILFRFAEKTEMPVRVLLRDENLELMDQYLTNGKSRTVPIYIFIDANGNEVAKWGPKSVYTAAFVDKHKASIPPKDAENYQEKFKEIIKFMTKSFQNDSKFWDANYEEIKESLANI